MQPLAWQTHLGSGAGLGPARDAACGVLAPQQNAQCDSQGGEPRMRKSEEPAWNLNLCREPDPQAGSRSRQQRPPAAEADAEHEAGSDQDRDQDALIIGTRTEPLESA